MEKASGLGKKTFALSALPSELPSATNGFRLLAGLLLGRLLEMVTALHLPKETFTLHLFLKRFQRLVDVVIAHHDLNDVSLSISQVRLLLGMPDRKNAFPSPGMPGEERIQTR